jgi:hypothetical protein
MFQLNYKSYPLLKVTRFDNYSMVNYYKNSLNEGNLTTVGLYRSVIINNETENVVCYSLPKSLPYDVITTKYNANELTAEEFVEGTMINVFWDIYKNSWYITTKRTIDAECSFFIQKPQMTFKEMFMDACNFCNLDLTNLDKECCYSFVLQHPSNRIVVPFTHPQLYLIRMYKVYENNTLENIILPDDNYDFRHQIHGFHNTTVRVPVVYNFTSYSDLADRFTSYKTPYNLLGYVLKSKIYREHCKVRNPQYNLVKELRGNNPRIDYHYFELRQQNKVMDFLQYYPEYIHQFMEFKKKLYTFTNQLYTNYVNCYIYKQNNVDYFNTLYKNHMRYIHKLYITKLKPFNKHINKTIVINYVNSLDIPIILHALNYKV